MVVINVEIPKEIKEKIWIWNTITYENLIIKTIWEEYISTDLKFTKYSEMSKKHQEEYDKLENIDKNKLLNI